jgi:hypothetical protein
MHGCAGCGLITTFLLHHYFGFSIYELLWNTVPMALFLIVSVPVSIILCQLATCSFVENWAWNRRNAHRMRLA